MLRNDTKSHIEIIHVFESLLWTEFYGSPGGQLRLVTFELRLVTCDLRLVSYDL